MFAKLALRNVKRQLGNYLIYFITVMLTVALMFAMNNVIYSEQMQRYAEATSEMRTGLTVLSVFIALIVSFILGYATSFMLKLRKREFGTYLTLGMTRGNLLCIFILETLLMGAMALGMGIVLGLFLYQGMMAMFSGLMEIEITMASYSMDGLMLTVVLVAGVFLLASLTSAVYLKRASVYDLIHGAKKVEKQIKHPVFWFIVALAGLGGIIWSCVNFEGAVESLMTGTGNREADLLISLFVLAVTVILFHIGLARSVVNLILNNKRLCARGTNTFTLRQLSGKLSVNSIMAGILAFLISFAVIGANASIMQKVSERVELEESFPFDAFAFLETAETPPYDLEQAQTIIEKYNEIEETIPYHMYSDGEGFFHNSTPWSGPDYGSLTDCFVSESEVNRLLEGMGKEPLQLNDSFYILVNAPQVMGVDFSKTVFERNGRKAGFGGITQDISLFNNAYFVVVLPDAMIEGMRVDADCAAMNLKNEQYDAEALRAELTYLYKNSGGSFAFEYERCDYQFKEYSRIYRNSTSAILIIGAIYIAVVFVFMAMAVLALKTLAGISDDQQRYAILSRLGTGEKEQRQTLFRQTFSFFLLPFALPALLSIPTGWICGRMMLLAGFEEQLGEVYGNTFVIVLVLAVLYLLYFTATYLIARRNVIRINN